MKIVLQRVSEAIVTIDKNTKAKIEKGLLLLLGITHEDTIEDIQWLVRKVTQMRVFSDSAGKMNHSISDIGGAFIVVSQFTLLANVKKGNRPSYIAAARPDVAIPLYEQFIEELSNFSKLEVQTGTFGADMKVKLVNDGPVTILLDSHQK